MHESDTYLAIIDEGQEKCARDGILLIGEDRISPPENSIRAALRNISDVDRLKRMLRRSAKAKTWQEILDTQ